MEESNKLSYKRVELSLTKFNEVAIPHHLDLLRQHKANIIKHSQEGSLRHVRASQTNARRVASQLRALLAELETLRRQVSARDLPRFDASTQRSRDLTLRAIMDYLESPALAMPQRATEEAVGSVASDDSVGVLPDHGEQLHAASLQEAETALREREEALRGWIALQAEVRALHDTWQHVQAAALHQREQVQEAAGAIEVADTNVAQARAHLWNAASLRSGAYCVGAALAGAGVAGPAGLLLGVKAGALAAVVGSIGGYFTAKIVTRPPREDKQDNKDKKD